jgi:hypothetical protein
MDIWKIEGTDRYVSAANKPIASAVFNVTKKGLIWVRWQELQELLLNGCTIEVCREPPIVQVTVFNSHVIHTRSGSSDLSLSQLFGGQDLQKV